MLRTIRPSATRHLCFGLWLIAACQLAACGSSDEANETATDASANDASVSDDGAVHDAGADGRFEVGPEGDGSNIPDGLLFDGHSDAPDADMDGGEGGLDGSADGSEDAPSLDAQADGDPGDSGAHNDPICYYGDFETDGTHETACLAFPGPVRTLLDASGLVGEWIESVAISPNREEVAMAVRESAGGRFKVQVVRLDGTAPPRELLVAPSAQNQVERLAYSVDGSRLALLADFDLIGTRSLYTVPVAGGTTNRISPKAESGKNVTGFAWARTTPGTDWLAYTGDLATDGVHGLWIARTNLPKPQPQPILSGADLGANGDVQSDIVWTSKGKILFRSNHGPDGVMSLYRATGDQVELVPGTSLSNAQGKATVASFGLSPDSQSVAFSANSPQAAIFEVFVASLVTAASTAQQVSALTVVSEPGMLSGPAFQTPIAWSADGTKLTVVADWRLASSDRDDSYAAFILPSAGPAGGWRVLGSPQGVDLNARDSRFSFGDTNLIVRGDLVENGAFELFVVTDPATPDQDPLDVRFEDVPSLGDVVGLAADP
jgi:hypothetical protein